MKLTKKIIILILSILFCLSGCQGHADKQESTVTGTCYAKQYDMFLKLDVEEKTLSGTVKAIVSNESDVSIDKICVRNYPASILDNGKKSILSNAIIIGDTPILLHTEEDKSVVYADLEANALEPNKTLEISFDFTTDIPQSNNRFGFNCSNENYIFQLAYCFPTISVFSNGEWDESPYINSGAEFNYCKTAEFNVEFDIPKVYTVAAVGKEERIEDIVRISAQNVREMAIIASNYMNLESKTIDGITINNYSLKYEGLEDYNKFVFLAAEDSLRLFSYKFGSYKFDELDIIQCYVPSASEYPGLIMLGYPDIKEINDIKDSQRYYDICSRIAHEVAHQWFYATVGNNPYREPWLDEGFAEFCEDILYCRHKCDSIQLSLKSDNERLGNSGSINFSKMSDTEFNGYMKSYIAQITKDKYTINKSYSQYKKGSEYSQYVYEGGKFFLYELMVSMGEETFFDMMRDYYETFSFEEATTSDFVNLVKEYNDSKTTKKIIRKYID